MNVSSWLNETINVATRSSLGAGGAPTYNAAAPVKARHEYDVRTVRAADGTERQVEHHVTTVGEINPEDRVWMPGDSTSNVNLAKRPVRIQEGKDKAGNTTHWETRF